MSLKKLNELELNLDLKGCEGLDINYVSRIRSQYLFTQHQTMITQMQFADAKAAALIALIGFITLRGPIKLDEISSLGSFGYIFLMCAGLAVVFTLFSVFPRYPSKAKRDALSSSDRWSWPALASDVFKPEEFSNYMRTAEVSQLLHSLSISNCYVADILLSKYRMLRIGFTFGLATMMLVGVKITGLV
jgi:hypothetical protein